MDSDFRFSDNLLYLITDLGIGLYVSKEEISFDPIMYANGTEQNAPSDWHCYSRLFTFEEKHVPVIFCSNLISQLMFYAKEIVSQKEQNESPYRDNLRGNDERNHTFNQNNAIYKQNYFLYSDNEISIKVKLTSKDPNSMPIENANWKPKLKVEVKCAGLDRGCKIFAKTIDEVENVINDFKMSENAIKRWAYCPAVNSCTELHDMDKTLKLYQEKDYDPNLEILCSNKHPALVKDLFPDMLLTDAPHLILSSCIQLEINRDDINLEKSNGVKGGYGTVYKKDHFLSMCCKDVKEKIAFKVLKESNNKLKDHMDLRSEALLMSKLADHPYILTFFGIAFKHLNNKNGRKSPLMVMELANHGDLNSCMNELPRCRVLLYRMAFQIADALNFMHSLNIYHRDLHPGNVLVFSDEITEDTNVKIADFGLSCHAVPQKGLQTGMGAKKYQPPELFDESKFTYDHLVDIYAFGLILYYMLTLKKPFDSIHHPLDVNKFKKNKKAHEDIFSREKVRADAICLKNLMKWCIAFYPEDRRGINRRWIVALLQNSCFQLLQASVSLQITVNSIINVGQSIRSKTSAFVVPVVISDPGCDTLTLKMISTNGGNRQSRVTFSAPDDGYISKDKYSYMAYARNDSRIILVKQYGNKKYCLVDVPISCNQIDIRGEKKHTGIAEQIQITNSGILFLLEVVKNVGSTIKRFNFPESPNSLSEILMINYLEHACTEATMQGHWPDGECVKSFAVCVEGKFLVVAFARKIVILTFGSTGLGILNNDCDVFENFAFEQKIKRIYLHQHSIRSKANGVEMGNDKSDNNESSTLNSSHNKRKCILVVVGEDCDKITFVPVILPAGSIYKFNHKCVQNYNLKSEVYRGPVNITAFCAVGDTYWFGAKNGLIYIVGYIQATVGNGDNNDNNDIQTVIKPYNSPVKHLVYINDTKNGEGLPKGILSYGDRLNAGAFNFFNRLTRGVTGIENSKANLHRTFLGQDRSNVTEDHASDLLLLWQAPTSLELDRLRMERRETNEKLQKIQCE